MNSKIRVPYVTMLTVMELFINGKNKNFKYSGIPNAGEVKK